MIPESFKALVVHSTSETHHERRITEKSIRDLPPGDVLIQVLYSSLNYKDALSASGNRGVTRTYPHTPGIDAAGFVAESAHPAFLPGDPVLVTGYDLGMNTSGGFGRYVRVPADWVVKLPENLSLKESMIYGTAGFTASLSIQKIVEHGLTPDSGDILVTGATGGVGSLAVSILSKIGYSVTAATGKTDQRDFLHNLGAKAVISRADIEDDSNRPLIKARWAGVVDTVGGNILASTLKSTFQRAAVTCCGNVASPAFATTVYPFILRGITLYGIDSASTPMPLRQKIWRKIAGEWKISHLDLLHTEIPLEGLEHAIERMLSGKQRGRVIVNLAN
ncbi:MAG: YhdH/YhfP family quinone oxidoreductase [Deltaproteobacteria bacterium]|nr:YhdH/YhfP family quinone oxidoreductase [Deltaproteobacteria bacterium]